MDEHEVEARLRAGLERRAEDADVTAPVVARAQERVARRRRTRLSVGAAAAAVVVVVGGVAVATRDGGGGTTQPADDGPTPSERLPGPREWRTEYWADVAVDVPADWGYGGAPDGSGTACFPEAMVGPDGEQRSGGSGLGFVGRPIAATDVCALVPDAWEPSAPYVWLGAGIEPGVHEYGNGYVQETVEVDGSTVTVGAADEALRARILATARGGEMCLSELPREGDIAHDVARGGDTDAGPVSLRVCVYQWDPDREAAQLTYAVDAGRRELADYETALEDAVDGGVDGCPTLDYQNDTWVVLELVDDAGSVVRQDVATTQCWLRIEVGARSLMGTGAADVALSPDLVEPWAIGGTAAIVHGFATTGDSQWLDDYFIGPQG